MQDYRSDLSAFQIESHWRKTTPSTRRLLVIYAHPDDESFGNAGTIARYTSAGADVHYACATRGEVGGVAPELLNGYPDIAALRSAELGRAAEALELTSYHFLGYRDSGMPDTPDNQHPQALFGAPVAEVAARITALIRVIQPQVVVTFGPYGGYGHPDHIAIHVAAMAAFDGAGDPHYCPDQLAAGLPIWRPRKLYYSTFHTRMLKVGLWVMRRLGKDPEKAGENGDVDFVRVLTEATPVTTTVKCGAFLEQKDRAWQAHRSQLGSMGMLLQLPRVLRRPFTASESFTRVVPAPNGKPEHDLFAGI
ncbi:MAG: PIG-L family deacetylase [Herpetosiphonaceae bacterium]|nr:PIG-L family deacetylase [Herpetosiphonaceae bacterium]